MPRLFRESPLSSIWEGSGQRAGARRAAGDGQEPGGHRRRSPTRSGRPRRREPRLDRFGAALAAELQDPEGMETRARRLVERMALALQGSLLVRFGDPAVADAFCASRLDGDWGHAFGTLPAGRRRRPDRRPPRGRRLGAG